MINDDKTMKKETELFEAVYHYFSSLGYEVRAEINNCDVVCMKDDELVIIELKLKFNLALLYQVSDRLRYTSQVYMALPKEEINRFKKNGKEKMHLARCLEVGIFTVSKDETGYIIEEILKPKKQNKVQLQKRNEKKIKRVITEFKGRDKLYNVGGSVRVPIHTAYKELSIKIAKTIGNEQQSIKEIRASIGDSKKIADILQKNHYGWFERVSHGVYKLTEEGKVKGLKEEV